MTASLLQGNPQEKYCFIIHSEDLGYEHTLHRLCLTEFVNADDFEKRAKSILELEKQKSLLSGKNWNPGVWLIANKFTDYGDVIEKQLAQMIGKRLKILKKFIYPSYNISSNVLKLVTEGMYWDRGIEMPEADFSSLFMSTASILRVYPEYRINSDFKEDSILKEDFLNLVKEHMNYVGPTFGNPPEILITDKHLTEEYSEQIVKMKPKIVLHFDDIGIINIRASERLIKNNIHIIPSCVTMMGNSLISQGLSNNKRTIDESFKLIQNQVTHFNSSIWDFSLNSRENFLTVINEIYNAMADEKAESRFRLDSQDVGTMSYLA
jgi:hypothetical protein